VFPHEQVFCKEHRLHVIMNRVLDLASASLTFPIQVEYHFKATHGTLIEQYV